MKQLVHRNYSIQLNRRNAPPNLDQYIREFLAYKLNQKGDLKNAKDPQ